MKDTLSEHQTSLQTKKQGERKLKTSN